MSKQKQFNRQATIEKIKEKAGTDGINNMDKFNELMQDEEFVRESAELWGVELQYS